MHTSKFLLKYFVIIGLFQTSFYATTINVPGDYGTIQEALNNASSGDVVLVAQGTYYENIFWPETNGIKLMSVGDSSNTIIDGSGISSVIYINPQTSTIDTSTLIQGFKITNGGNVTYGGGIFTKTASPKILNVWIHNNYADKGGGVYAEANGIIIENSRISNNNVLLAGGGLYFDHSSNSARLKNCTIENNTTRYDQNGATSSGGGIYLDYSELKISDCSFISNKANEWGGAINSFRNNILTINNCNFESNTVSSIAGFYGGAIWCYSTLYMSNSEIINNSAPSGGGIAINNAQATITNTKIINNTSTISHVYGGGGIYIDRGTLNYENIIIANNTTGRDGGGIWIRSGSSLLPVTNGIITIVYNSADNFGGAMRTNVDNTIHLKNATIVDNSSIDNLDGCYFLNASGSTISFTDVNFLNNGYSIFNTDNSILINASNLYWGHSTGPYHPAQNTSGLGDSTNFFVNVTPWLNEPSITAPPIPASNVLISDFGSGFVSLSWDASLIGDLAGYKIYYDTDNEDYPYRFSVDAGNVTSFTIDNITATAKYFFAVVVYDIDGNESWFTKADTSVYLATENSRDIPNSINLYNLPNPFNPSTTIHYNIPIDSRVNLTIYDMLGRKVNQLISSNQPLGNHSIKWNGTDLYGNLVSAGIYFYQLKIGDFVQTKKMLLLR